MLLLHVPPPGHGFTALRWGFTGLARPGLDVPKGVFVRGHPFDGSYEAPAGFPAGASLLMEAMRILVSRLRWSGPHRLFQ